MNLINRMISYDKTKNVNQESCNCAECVSENAEISEKKEFIGNFEYADDFLIKVENHHMMCREKEISNIMNLEYWYKDIKTKNFIWKVLHIHGDKYIYHKTVYVKWDEKVEIECKIKNHPSFPQTPNRHLNGRGCPKCKFEKLSKLFRLTKEEFIEKSNEKHGEGRYDYSKVKYVNNTTEVIIICHNHNEPYEFPQTPQNHMIGQGCPKCKSEKIGNMRRLTLDEFIEEANKIQGIGRYDYSKVNYVNERTEVIITCPIHGDFPQKPINHLQGKGCSLCNKKSKGEIKITRFLTNNNIQFEREKRFSDCRNIRPLPFDFYLPKYNLCIEFDGIQHFKPIKRSYKMTDDEIEKNFKYIQKHDQIKNDYCKNNGIILIRLNNLKTVEKELTKYFQEYGIL